MTDAKYLLIRDTNSTKTESTKDFFAAFLNQLMEVGMQDKIQLVRVADIGLYNKGIVVKALPSGHTYTDITESDIKRLIDTFKNGKTLDDKLYKKESNKQIRIVLRNCGVINPESIEEYLDRGGYQGLRNALCKKPVDAIEEMKKAGLRGRGGAGFPTWMKWKLTSEQKADQRFVICNGDEGDPGAYMDRSVLEGDPHSVLEGLAIAAYAVGATKGFFYIRAEYPLAVQRIEKAIKQAKEYGFLGTNILGTDFNLELEIRLGAGAFVCGEETSLIASIEGKRGTPRPRPPFPSVKGLWGKPTSINNVETLANVPVIFKDGAEKFASIGTEKSKGTKVFALTGHVCNTGLIEVPMGITLREIVYDIGGGVLDGRKIKAVQTGGPSGGVIPEQFLDTPVDFENLGKLGSIMGSGGMIVLDEHDCVVDVAKFYMQFCVDESCGKCAPCRIGTYQMKDILTKITDGKGDLEDIVRLKDIGFAMQKASLCGLGQTAANPVLSTVKYFEAEYLEHINNHKCPAKKCKSLISYVIIPDKCKRCRVCVKNCPENAISGDRESGYVIDQAKCIKCGLCLEVCKFNAVLGE
jgi:NADH:ubiquinone oxidoreductase subunit F (NADH-binding)